jgi:mitochondrial-processing peptidase subunit beta
MLRSAATALRQHHESVSDQLRRYALVATTKATSYVESMPVALPWNAALSQLQPTQVATLSNGLRVASQVIPYTEVSTVGVYLDAGSRYETDENSGVAHFLEHLMFKGTKKRSIRQMEVEVENMGAALNAYTSRESTAYFARCLGKDVGRAVDILGDMVMNSRLSEDAVFRERDVILREAKEIDAMIEEVVMDHLHSTAFQHTPLGRTILGPAQNIQKMTKEDLESYIRTHYTSGRMVLVAAGNVDHNELVTQAEKMFASLPPTGVSAAELVAAEPSHFTGSAVSVRDPNMQQTGLAVAFKGVGHADPDSVTLAVMANMLGSWSRASGTENHKRSQLATLVASNDLADRYQGFSSPYHDVGLFGIYAQTSKPKHLEDLAWAIMQEMTKMAYDVDEADVQLARNSMKMQALITLSSSNGICEDISRQLLMYNRVMPREELFARIDAVTKEAVQDCASRRIQDQDMAIAAVGELSFLPNYNWFRRRSYWNRY